MARLLLLAVVGASGQRWLAPAPAESSAAAGTFADAEDHKCSPGASCTGESDPAIPSNRGICVGPHAGCSTGLCKCKDVCNVQNEPEDYADKELSGIQREAIIMLVKEARKNNMVAMQNVVCPASTQEATDAETCGNDGVVGNSCSFPGGSGQCATDEATGQIQCKDLCDWSIPIDDFAVGATKEAKDKAISRRGDCTTWYMTFGTVLFYILLVVLVLVLLVLAGAAVHFFFVHKPKREQKAMRAVRTISSNDYREASEPSARLSEAPGPVPPAATPPNVSPGPLAQMPMPMTNYPPHSAPAHALHTGPSNYSNYTTMSSAPWGSHAAAPLAGAVVHTTPYATHPGVMYTSVPNTSR